MPRYSVGVRSTGAGSTTLPVGALVASASVDLHVVEVGVFNSTATACNVTVRRITSAGTPGTGLSEIPWDPDAPAATGTGFDTYTSTGPTLTAGFYSHADLGAAIGSGIIFTYGERGLRIPKGTANGIVIIPGTGTGQILDWYMIWDE
jgi:hypothetical protein